MQEVRSQDIISTLLHSPVDSGQHTDVVYTPFSGVLPSKMTRYSLRQCEVDLSKIDDEGRFVFNLPIGVTDHVMYDVSFIGCGAVDGMMMNAEVVAVFSDGEERVISRRFITSGEETVRCESGDLIIKPHWMFRELMTGLQLFRMKGLTSVKILLSMESTSRPVRCAVSMCSLNPLELQAHKDEKGSFLVTIEDINLPWRGGFALPAGSTVKSVRWSKVKVPTTLSIPRLVDKIDTRFLRYENEYSCDVRNISGLDRVGNTFFSGMTDMIVDVPGASWMIATVVRMWEMETRGL